MDKLDIVEKLLKTAKLRRTPVRAGVLDVLSKSSRPLGAVEVLEKLPPYTDAVTVYRTLNTFTTKKMIHRIRGEDRVWRYALGDDHQSAQHLHPHFVCESCGKVECLRDTHVPATLLEKMQLSPKYKLSHAEIVLHGTCAKCSA